MMKKEIKTELTPLQIAVAKVVDWWAEKSFDQKLNQRNGDDSPTGGIYFAMANSLAGRIQNEITNDQKLSFKIELTNLILAQEERITKWGLILDVDYHPCEELHLACKAAEINTNCLPIKSCTRLEKDFTVNTRFGYGSNWEKI